MCFKKVVSQFVREFDFFFDETKQIQQQQQLTKKNKIKNCNN